MRYSYEFKRKCVEMYYRGEYPDTPDGIGSKRFHKKFENGLELKNRVVLMLYDTIIRIKNGLRKNVML